MLVVRLPGDAGNKVGDGALKSAFCFLQVPFEHELSDFQRACAQILHETIRT